MDADVTWNRWRKQIGELQDATTRLLIDDAIFRQSMLALSETQRGRSAPIVYDWILHTYGAALLEPFDEFSTRLAELFL